MKICMAPKYRSTDLVYLGLLEPEDLTGALCCNLLVGLVPRMSDVTTITGQDKDDLQFI